MVINDWLVVWKAVNSQAFQGCGGPGQSWDGQVRLGFLTMVSIPDFGAMDSGDFFDVVVRPIFFDATHEAHVLECTTSGKRFLYKGLLELRYVAHTLFRVQFVKQYPHPRVQASDQTRIFDHEVPTWHSLRSTIDACSGIGALAQGALAAGFTPSVSVDVNHRMVNLCAKTSNGECIQGDIGADSTLFELWKHAKYSKTMSAGFNCQPFSKLGDGKGGKDPRSACLPMVLRAAHLMQIQIIVLECVQPAASDEFVKAEISKFQQCTGFHCRQVNLSLQDAWPTRRDRAWWILSSPLVGPIDLEEMPVFSDLDTVRKVIPRIFPWSEEDENALALSEVELDGFGVSNDSHQRYLLNMGGKAPCALHSWGSQLHPCQCGCRSAGLASWRLEQKGLFGLLVRSCDGRIRHVHPNEAMMLNALDPIPDLGNEPRLSLCGVGQLASPLQALWIFSHIDKHLNLYRFGNCPFSPIMQVQAYRAWLLMRGRQIWHDDIEPIEDPRLLTLVEVWKQVKDLSLPEVVYPFRWPSLSDRDVTIAAVLDHLMKQPKHHEQHDPHVPDDCDDPTPWFEQPFPDEFPVYPQGDVCMIHFPDSGEAPVTFALPEDSAPNFGDFLIAQAKLTGPACHPLSARCDGQVIDSYQRLQAGQVIRVCPTETDGCDTDVQMDASSGICHPADPNDGKLSSVPSERHDEVFGGISSTCHQGEWGLLPICLPAVLLTLPRCLRLLSRLLRHGHSNPRNRQSS